MLSRFNEDASIFLQNLEKKDERGLVYDFNPPNWPYSSRANVMKVGGLA